MQNRRKTKVLSHLSDLKIFLKNEDEDAASADVDANKSWPKEPINVFSLYCYAALLRHALRGRGLMFMGHCVCDITQKQ